MGILYNALSCCELSFPEYVTIPVTPFSETITTIITRRSLESLKLVRSVASQFRATPNKSSTTTPSYFIPSILAPLHALFTSRSALQPVYGKEWSTRIVDSVLSSYAGILASVRKTEDLLRRHRKSKKTGFSLFGGGTTDGKEDDLEEEKFRAQMRVDIDALRTDAESFGVDVEALDGWNELVEVVNRPAE